MNLRDPVTIKFSTVTPLHLLSLSYGIFYSPVINLHFSSIDAFLAFNMLKRKVDRQTVMRAPNGYLANRALNDILRNAVDSDPADILHPTWELMREPCLRDAVNLKFHQSPPLANLLLSTRDYRITDASRDDDFVYCVGADGTGQNMHGKALEWMRGVLRTENADAIAAKVN